jgi:hypothetical protein
MTNYYQYGPKKGLWIYDVNELSGLKKENKPGGG